jgi:hypothetical protein
MGRGVGIVDVDWRGFDCIWMRWILRGKVGS